MTDRASICLYSLVSFFNWELPVPCSSSSSLSLSLSLFVSFLYSFSSPFPPLPFIRLHFSSPQSCLLLLINFILLCLSASKNASEADKRLWDSEFLILFLSILSISCRDLLYFTINRTRCMGRENGSHLKKDERSFTSVDVSHFLPSRFVLL